MKTEPAGRRHSACQALIPGVLTKTPKKRLFTSGRFLGFINSGFAGGCPTSCRRQPVQDVRCGRQGQAESPGKGSLTSRLFGQSWGVLGSRGPKDLPQALPGEQDPPPSSASP